MCGAPPPPPPPMFGGPGIAIKDMTPQKKKYTKPKATKRLNWTPILFSKLNEESLWKDANESQYESEKVIDQIIEQFSTKSKPLSNKIETSEATFAKKKTKEPQVIDGKTTNNLCIFLGGVKIPYNEVILKIYQFDTDFLTDTFIETLTKFLPPQEQLFKLNMLMELDVPDDDLCEAELFLKKTSTVPDLLLRMNFMLIMSRFDEYVTDVKPVILMSLYLKLLLFIGNYMNAESRIQQSHGFEITFLNNLADTKTQNGLSFMHFLSDLIVENYPNLIGFDKEFPSVQGAMKVNEEQLVKGISQIAKNVSQIESNLPKFEIPANPDDKFGEFHKKASEQLIVLKEMYENLKKEFDAVCSYFSVTTKMSYEEFFGIFYKFFDDFNKAYSDNKRKADQLERDRLNKERQEQNNLKKDLNKKSAFQFQNSSKESADNGVGKDRIMEELFQAMESGSAFKKTQSPNNFMLKKKKATVAVNPNILADRKRTMNSNSREVLSQLIKQDHKASAQDSQLEL
ncbi:hypothetical protein MXB_2832 [Myxobolus squamalis]|nr:hypothetical protein MXB_2832 [Myxobolus squamalis]